MSKQTEIFHNKIIIKTDVAIKSNIYFMGAFWTFGVPKTELELN